MALTEKDKAADGTLMLWLPKARLTGLTVINGLVVTVRDAVVATVDPHALVAVNVYIPAFAVVMLVIDVLIVLVEVIVAPPAGPAHR